MYTSFDEIKQYQKDYRKEYNKRPKVMRQRRKYGKKYRQKPEVKKRKNEYTQRPEVKKKQKEHQQKPEIKANWRIYNNIYKNLESVIMDIFNKEEYTEKELTEKLEAETGFKIKGKTIRKTVRRLEKRFQGENSPIIYNSGRYLLNKESPYWIACNGYWK